jgi:hypothetical protein
MRPEEQLHDAYERAAGLAPVPPAAYDRFLRRRARYARRVAAAASLTLAAAVALAVAVPRVLADRQDVAGLPKGQMVSRPELGYELAVPPGWRANADGATGLRLEPAPGTPGAAPPGVVPVPTTLPRTGTATTVWVPRPALSRIWVEPTVLRPGYYPDDPDSDHANWQGTLDGDRFGWAGMDGPADAPYRFGRRPDGRGFLLQGSTPNDPNGQHYYVAWPYYCPAGVRCPLVLRYRALTLWGWAATEELARTNAAVLRRLVDTVRPAGHAVPGGAANHPDCRLEWRDQRQEWRNPGQPVGARTVVASVATERTGNPPAAGLVVTFSTQRPAMCRVRASFAVELLEGSRQAAVQGNGATVTVEGDLPEGDGESPTFTRAWLWRNWCGSRDVSLRLGGPDGVVIPAKTFHRPGCADPGRPSTLESTSLPIRP